jgi:hypothetical protein
MKLLLQCYNGLHPPHAKVLGKAMEDLKVPAMEQAMEDSKELAMELDEWRTRRLL